MFAVIRVKLPGEPKSQDDRWENTNIQGAKVLLRQKMLKGMIDGFHRAKIPYVSWEMSKPDEGQVENPPGDRLFEFDRVMGTWVDSYGDDWEEVREECERNIAVIAASITVGLPDFSVERLQKGGLKRFVSSFLLHRNCHFSKS